ncbi:RagB/SusD family nutrient uptake outer membrane protein [Pedobacter deserti]|uniref:RagB/SusD family nutrient uptake outer membrane protein n=1 Tax=Pedobacter deserti TaxID=2817382 RepID=UPI00210AA5AE|nr:RagB/SusD family nutrient uptake outer membrane protein [Pedobacter sp. SYSU D00382]
MKIKHIIYTCLALAVAFVSCKKWIDVEPKTNIENDRFFSSPAGFTEALNGVYLNMGNVVSYGRDMTWGLVDVMGRTYVTPPGNAPLSGAYVDAVNGNYQSRRFQDVISATYLAQYNSIANLNNILEKLESKASLLSTSQYKMIKGEALGLRAFLHFDMLRLFTKSYADGGENTQGVPYVTVYKPIVTPRLTVKDAMENILKDLDQAEQMLSKDTIITGSASDILDTRRSRFNYYAVKATKARAYLWKGDKPNALKNAEDIIAISAAKFPFVRDAELTVADAQKNRVFTREHLFGLVVPKLATNYVGFLDSNRAAGLQLAITRTIMNDQYEATTVGSSDIRRVYLLKDLTALPSPNNRIYFSKLHQPALSNRMPLIKIPEMYYIAAECLAENDPNKAVGYLNTVRTARGITAPLVIGTSGLETEIRREYRKEMPNEGQVFFYYKRLNTTSVPQIAQGTLYPTARYVIPLPQAEIDFGN